MTHFETHDQGNWSACWEEHTDATHTALYVANHSVDAIETVEDSTYETVHTFTETELWDAAMHDQDALWLDSKVHRDDTKEIEDLLTPDPWNLKGN